MSKRRASLPPPLDELVVVQELVASIESQISTINALLLTFTTKLKSTHEKQEELGAELPTRRKSLLEWTQSKEILLKTLQGLSLKPPSRLLEQTLTANRTAMPLDDVLARRLAEREKEDIDAIRVSIDMRDATIADLRSRVTVLEEGIAGCESAASHIRSMIAVQTPHRDRLNDLLRQFKLRLHPVLRLPDTCLQDIFLHVARLCWERCTGILLGEEWNSVVSAHECHPALAITAVCYRWRVVGTHTSDLWSKIRIGGGMTSRLVARFAHYIRLANNRALSIIITQWSRFKGRDIQLLSVFKTKNVKLDSLGIALYSNVYESVAIMRVLPSPRALILQGDSISSSVSIPQECLSGMENLTVLGCTASIITTAPALRSFELHVEYVTPSTISAQYLPSLLQRLPKLECLIIRCQTVTESLYSGPPSLLVEPGVCESVTWLQIPLMALCNAVKGLQDSFVLPNLVKLSLLNFLRDGTDLPSWRSFCGLNGRKIKHLYLSAGTPMSDSPSPLHGQYTFEITEHLQCLAGISILSLSASLVDSLLQALMEDMKATQGNSEDSLLVPNMEICEIHSYVKTPDFMEKTEEQLGLWSNARDVMRDEAAGRCEAVRVLWP